MTLEETIAALEKERDELNKKIARLEYENQPKVTLNQNDFFECVAEYLKSHSHIGISGCPHVNTAI